MDRGFELGGSIGGAIAGAAIGVGKGVVYGGSFGVPGVVVANYLVLSLRWLLMNTYIIAR